MYQWKPISGFANWKNGEYWQCFKDGSIVGAVHMINYDKDYDYPAHSHVFAISGELVVNTHLSMNEAAKFVIYWGNKK